MIYGYIHIYDGFRPFHKLLFITYYLLVKMILRYHFFDEKKIILYDKLSASNTLQALWITI